MKKFLLSLLFIAGVWFSIDRIGGLAMNWVTWNTSEHVSHKICKIVSSIDSDILLLGTSRCECHYIPSIISDSTGMSVYNAGLSASGSIYFQYMTLSHVLTHHTPKVVVLDTGESEFCDNDNQLNMLTYYAPHIGRCPEADSVFQWVGIQVPYRISHLYRYHSLSNVAIARLFKIDSEFNDGYTPIAAPPSFPKTPGLEQPPVAVDQQRVSTFRRFIALCRQHNIRLVLSISPSYSLISEHYYDELRRIAAEEHLPLLDYDTSGLYKDHPEYFYDNAHLWDEGARLFSQRFAHDLKVLLGD